MKSWHTTIAGILGAIAMLATQVQYIFDSDPATNFELTAVVAALSILALGVRARDNHRNSSSVGAEPTASGGGS